MVSASLGDYIREYRDANPEDVVVVEEPVDINYEPTAYYELLEKRNPLIWFKRVKGFEDFELIANVLSSKQRIAFAIGCPVDQLYDTWSDIISYSGSPGISGEGSVKQKKFTGNQVDLFQLPATKHYTCDGAKTGFGRYINSGIAVARNPLDKSIINLSYTRMQIIGKSKYAFSTGSRGHLWHYAQIARERKERLPVSIVVGTHPIYYLLASSFIENEYMKATKLIRSDLVEGELNDIPVPSEAEIVIEAEIIPDEIYDEGPVAEFLGYVAHGTTGNVAEVKSIFRREKPIFYDIIPSNSTELVLLSEIPRNAAITRAVRQFMPPSSDYAIEWPLSSSHFMSLCYVTKPQPGLVKQVGLALIALDSLFSKFVVVNEGVTDLSLENLLVSLAVQRPERGVNVEIFSDMRCIILDPTATPQGTNGRMLIITKGPGEKYEKIIESRDKVRLVTESSQVVLSHEPTSEGTINVILGKDIDLTNPDQVTWAVSTRLAPDKDVVLEAGKMTITATRGKFEIPVVPEEVVKNVEARIRNKKL